MSIEIELLQIGLLVITILILIEASILRSIIYMAVYSVIISIIYYFLDAPDVSLAEFSIGAGISTFILIKALPKRSDSN